MATHSSVLAWRIPGTGEPGGLPSMGSHRVGHDWSDADYATTFSDVKPTLRFWNNPPLVTVYAPVVCVCICLCLVNDICLYIHE